MQYYKGNEDSNYQNGATILNPVLNLPSQLPAHIK
uniref:Uncharacterized protein n=1 Tax=Arundo donax TaxID=35708 RepID=A0A0A8Z5Y0_ARUDO